MDGFREMTGQFIAWPLEIFFSGESEMGIWGVVSLLFLEDDGKTYANADRQTSQHIFVGYKQVEKSKSFPRSSRKKSWLKN